MTFNNDVFYVSELLTSLTPPLSARHMIWGVVFDLAVMDCGGFHFSFSGHLSPLRSHESERAESEENVWMDLLMGRSGPARIREEMMANDEASSSQGRLRRS